MSRHKAEPEQSPLLLIGVFVVFAALVVGIVQLARPSGEVEHVADRTTATPTTASPSASERARPLSRKVPDRQVQRGHVIRPVPKPTCRQAAVDLDITVLSYNIKSARVGGGIGAYLGIIRASGADVVLLQEVDVNRAGTGRIHQPAWLAGNLGGWDWAFGANVGGTYGTAILSRFPIVSQVNTHLPNGPGGQQRGLLKAVADVEGVAVSFYSTHLQNKIDHLKVRQARAIAPIVAADPNPKVLGGDMNSWPGDQPVQILEGPLDDTWGAVGVGGGATHGPGRIDYLMHGGAAITPVRSEVLGYRNSDHRPLRATYDVDGATERICS